MDTYKTLSCSSPEVVYKEKGSKFLAYAFPVNSQEEIKSIVETLKKKHHSARHWCYAWQLGVEKSIYRANDDGEPGGTAGLPIFGQIQSFNLTNVLIVVVRYFGGIKLGVGGLVQAYKTSAQMALEASHIEERLVMCSFKLTFEYKDMNRVMRIVKEKGVEVVAQQMSLNCVFEIRVRKKDAEIVFEAFNQVFGVKVEKI